MRFPVQTGLAYRAALIVASVAFFAGILSLALIAPIANEKNRADVAARLEGLIDTVITTTSAACFVEDKVLARDVANGLVKNSVVSGVIIRSASSEMVNISSVGESVAQMPAQWAGAISRPVFSPFDASAQIGEIVIVPNHDELTRLSRESLAFTAFILVLQLCAISLATIYAVFKWIVLPIKSMSDELHHMPIRERTALPVPPGHAASELGRLVGDINDLTSSLAHAKEVAEKASRSKGDFLSTMSHEIRTPINAVVGMAYLALKTDLSAKQRDYIEKIRDSGRHLLDLVNDLLDFSKIESEKLELEVAEFSLDQTIERIASIAGVNARNKGLNLAFDVDPETPRHLVGDALRVGQILLNYINNAIKFTAAGAIQVHVRVLERADHECKLLFEVTDCGIGLSETQIGQLFRLFQQADASTTRKYGGTGLGLAISKQLAELMGGEVGVRSTLGVGSTFWASIRVGLPAASDGIPAHEFVAEGRVNGTLRFDGVRILLAEDNLLNQQIARELLEDVGAVITVANDGKEVLERVADGVFDCVLMDVRMPTMDGIQATQALRSIPAMAEMPIIAMTANAMIEDRAECLKAGMNDFIAKPVNPEQFFMTLSKWVASSTQPAPSVQTEMPKTPVLPGADLQHIDLREISRIFKNDTKRIDAMVRQFVDSGRQAQGDIKHALQSGDVAMLAGLAHRLKSSSKSMGAFRFSELLEAVEFSAKAGALDKLAAVVALLNDEWAELERELSAIDSVLPG